MISRVIFIILTSFFVLSGCLESKKTTKQLCNETPELQCEQKYNMGDGQCPNQRIKLIEYIYDNKLYIDATPDNLSQKK